MWSIALQTARVMPVNDMISKPVALWRLLRPAQWVKNGFVLAPLIFARRFDDIASVLHAVLALATFSALASAIYAINDIVDVEADRTHPVKRLRRPLAAGQLSLADAALTAAALLACVGVALFWLPALWPAALAYLLLNVTYSLWLKHVPVADLFAISGSFLVRIYAGALAIGVPVSHWMLITAVAITLFMAILKRKGELASSGNEGRKVLAAYTPELLDKYAVTAATCAIVFYGLYAVSVNPALAPTTLFVLAGVFRYWLLAERPDHVEDPTGALLKDKPLLAIGGAWLATSAWLLAR